MTDSAQQPGIPQVKQLAKEKYLFQDNFMLILRFNLKGSKLPLYLLLLQHKFYLVHP